MLVRTPLHHLKWILGVYRDVAYFLGLYTLFNIVDLSIILFIGIK